MKKYLTMTATALLMSTTATFAVTTDEVVQQLADEGFTNITVKHGVLRDKVKGYLDGVEREIYIRNSDGEIIKDKSEGQSTDGSGSGSDDDSSHDQGDDDGNDHGDNHDDGNDDGDNHDSGDNHDDGDDNSGGNDDDHGDSGDDSNG